MKIGIDTRVPTRNKTGIAYILDNILPYLVSFNQENKYILFGKDFGMKDVNVKNIDLPKIIQKAFNFLWKNIFFPSASIVIGKTDSFFFSNFVDFPVNTKKKVLMVPDLSYIKFPQFSEKKNLRFLKRCVGPSIKRADKIITISESAKNEIVEYYNIPKNKVEVVYLGCPENIKKVTDTSHIDDIKNKYGFSGKYIFFVGTLEPRKNIEGLISAYSQLNDSLKKEYKLVICGARGWYYDKIFLMIKELSLKENIVFTGYASEDEISSLYSGATVFVLPSFYEGFGMPILEAYKCDVPVVTSDNSSLREVGGDACIYCNAESPESIKESIQKVLVSDDLKLEMIKKGREQLKKFSWEVAAKKIFDILN